MISKDFGLGIVLMYNGTGIGVGNGSGSTDPEKRYNRTNEISESNGDSFDMKGFYVCNGKVSGVPDLAGAYDSGNFPRGANNSGSNQSGGNDDAVLIQHDHSASSGYGGVHNHSTISASGTHFHCVESESGNPIVINEYITGKGIWIFGGANQNSKTGGYCKTSTDVECTGNHTHTLRDTDPGNSHSHSTTSTGGDSKPNRNMSLYHSVIPIIRKD
ncbi:MAG: hypothetical protein V3V14_11215 [Saprospiraceae bacterium]